MLNQSNLFEVSQTTKIMLSGNLRYKALTEAQRPFVRAYIAAHDDNYGKITNKDWMDHARKHKGVSRYRAYVILKKEPVPVWTALREVLHLTGEIAEQYGALALYTAGLQIYEGAMSGERTTRILTSIELEIMRECVPSLSPAQLIGFTSTVSKGNQTSGTVAGRGDPHVMATNAAAIIKGLQAQMDLARGENRSGADGYSGDGSGIVSDFVQDQENNSEDIRENSEDSRNEGGKADSADDKQDDKQAISVGNEAAADSADMTGEMEYPVATAANDRED